MLRYPPKFGQVRHTVDRVAIFGTGPSLLELDGIPTAPIIAVNGAIELIPADFWFTLDPNKQNRAFMGKPVSGTVYYAAVPDDYGNRYAQCADHRKPAERHVIFLRRILGNGHGRLRTKTGLSTDKHSIHTGNSAWGALQLAVLMGAKKIALFGIDGNGDYYHGNTKPINLSMMPSLFTSSCGQLQELGVQVINGSPHSTVTCFHRVSPKDAIQWISSN